MRIQENGVAGEARTRAFLLDRFWILERSVDIEGADFFIQRRLTARSLLDRDPPKLGVVQAKFFQDEKTTQYMHREYVEDEKGIAREEVFLICHTGSEDNRKMFFATAKDIQANFKVSASEKHSDQYMISGREMLADRWLVTSQSRTLMLIEQALINADFARNRRFLSWALPNLEENTAIDPDFREEIDNWYGSIPREFFELREKARDAAYELDDYLLILQEIVETNSPKVAVLAAERFDQESLRHVGRDLFHREFAEVVLRHDRWVQELKTAGLLDAHASLRRQVLNYITAECLKYLPFENGALFRVEVHYDIRTLQLKSISSSIVDLSSVMAETDDKELNKYSGVISSKPGLVAAFIDPSVQEPWLTNPEDALDPEDYPSRGVHYLVSYVMGAVLGEWYSQSDEIPPGA